MNNESNNNEINKENENNNKMKEMKENNEIMKCEIMKIIITIIIIMKWRK